MSAGEPLSSRLAHPWRARSVVGAGAAGRVAHVVDAAGRHFALKTWADPDVAARELSALRLADRRYGPRLIEVTREGQEVAAALEWVEGTPLDVLLRDVSDARARERLAAVVVHAVGRALAELHGVGLRHGDVKPANIVVHAHTPTRDAAADRGATLIDLSLATEMQDGLRGATVAYLAPEARGDARLAGPETDLFALGVVMRDIVGTTEDVELARLVHALTSAAPGARPSASYVADRAAHWLGLVQDDEERVHERRARVRRAYLAARRRELAAATHLAPTLVGICRGWIEGALTSEGKAAEVEVGPSDAIARARWLTSLFGAPPPSSWMSDLDEQALADKLLALAEKSDTFAYGDLHDTGGVRRSFDGDLLSAAVALAKPRPEAAVLAWSEAHLAGAPESFVLTLAEAWLRVGEIARAFFAAEHAGRSARAFAMRAEVARRSGDREAALLDGERALATEDVDGNAHDRARAVLARLAWDVGDYDRAESVVQGSRGAFAVEVRALVALGRGDIERGARDVEQALALGASDEERARLEGVRGMLEHARGRTSASRNAFAAAARFGQAVSVVEEATYLTGLAAACADEGAVADALAASLRAALLWERLGRPAEAARAWLARASVLALIGADHEARAAADEVIARAHGRDSVAEAFARLVHVETRPPRDAVAVTELSLASSLVRSDEDVLRVDARKLVWSPASLDAKTIHERDRRADDASPPARWEWWGARAEAARREPSHADAPRILASLVRLLALPAPVTSRIGALRAGTELARASLDGEIARRFEAAHRALTRAVRENTPDDYRARFEASPLARADAALAQTSAHGADVALEPGQIAQLESLVRALGARDRLGPLLDQVLDALLLWTGVERGLLLLRAPDGSLVPRAARNLARRDLDDEHRALSQGIARRAIEQGDVVVATDAFSTLGDLHASVHSLRLRSVLAVPLIARGEALGVVYLDDRLRRGAFGPREIAWVRLVGTHAALAIADARDAVKLRRAVRHAERARARVLRDLEARELELDRAQAANGALDANVRYDGLAGRSEAMKRTLHLVARVSRSDVPVLLIGESGSGKELLARAVHASGARRGKPFVTENCGAVPETLLESILFGHKKGAFTGATGNRAGLFEVADGGTLFLDEIGEMSPGMQSKLLRVLQDGEIRAVGGERTRRVDVRILAATHRDLEAMVKAGTFREDLFYRLNVVRIDVPSLRDRAEDIPLLVSYFVEKHAAGRNVRITRAALDKLAQYPWPGNVRQLENEVRRALVLGGDRIDAAELSPEVLRGVAGARPAGTDLRSRLDALEAELVQEALDKTRGNQTRAAEILGVSRFGLQKMIKRLGLRVPV